MDATWIRKRCGDNDAMTERLTAMVSLIDDTIKTVRRISSELRPGILDDLGLIPALEWQCTEFSKNTGLECHFQSNKNDIEVDSNMAINIFRIYQYCPACAGVTGANHNAAAEWTDPTNN
jgi:signal transduction histidine kinase